MRHPSLSLEATDDAVVAVGEYFGVEEIQKVRKEKEEGCRPFAADVSTSGAAPTEPCGSE